MTRLLSGNECLAELSTRVDVLARTQWVGYSNRPKLLSAFCLPNDPAVDQVLSRASDILREEGRTPSLIGYDAENPERVREMVNAIWAAIAQGGIEYAYPQVSFNTPGQRIRTPSMVINGKVSTCLDLTLLFCAALEQAYLHPVVILEQKHAFAGVHLVPSDLDAGGPVLDRVKEVRRRMRARKLLLFETTAVTKEPLPFKQAVAHARRATYRMCRNRFQHLIDIHASRAAGIRPLPLHDDIVRANLDRTGTRIALEGVPAAPSDNAGADRLDKWRRKLLDLSPRNPLIDTKNPIVPLEEADAGAFLGRLGKRSTATVMPRNGAAESDREGLITVAELESEELNRRLQAMQQRDRSAREEGGASVFFLAIGSLRWHSPKDIDRELSSPLLLVPLRLNRASLVAPWQIRYEEGTSFLNPALGAALDHHYQLGIEKWDEIHAPSRIDGLD